MGSYFRLHKSTAAKHLCIESLTFSLYSKEEAHKLAVVPITSLLSLDPLGHPVSGGLYDIRMGPMNDTGDPCGTCGKSMFMCEGHFGKIELPLPVVNPLCHKVVSMFVKIACLKCFRLQIPEQHRETILSQLKLLDSGHVIEALEVAATLNELFANYDNLTDVPSDVMKKHANGCFTSLITSSTELGSNGCATSRPSNKLTESVRSTLMSILLKLARSSKCLFCQDPLQRIQLVGNRITVFITGPVEVPPEKSTAKKQASNAVSKPLTALECRDYLRSMWMADDSNAQLMQALAPVLRPHAFRDHPTDVLFTEVVLVVPPCVRPIGRPGLSRAGDHPRTHSYRKVLTCNIGLRVAMQLVRKEGDLLQMNSQVKEIYNAVPGSTPIEKMNNAWEGLQKAVNFLMDNSLEKSIRNQPKGLGLKQIIEKKDGIIRMNMMGKRVNYSARSVITPDPNLDVDEVGVPQMFAMALTYPVAVTARNIEQVRTWVRNGPSRHPGAVMVEHASGRMQRIRDGGNGAGHKHEEVLKQLLTPDEEGFVGLKKIHRHLMNGDVVLLNRQPTLHRPSIMAHRVRVLPGEKTLRLHYANCKAYNADFDGDEMNIHLPQGEISRSEAVNIVNVCNQYLVPKDGTPLSGLIQDYMVSGVRLTVRGRFFNSTEYHMLVYQGLAFGAGHIETLPPAIWKPIPLWSGKQIISTVLLNLIRQYGGGAAPINLRSTSKISAAAWRRMPTNNRKSFRKSKWGGTPLQGLSMSEAEVVFREGELLCGVLDKNHYGATPYGLVHCVYELYGGYCASRLLSALAKVFMRFLQQEGFTLGVRDILTTPNADKRRAELVSDSSECGQQICARALDLPLDTPLEEIVHRVETGWKDEKFRANLDRHYKMAIDRYTNDINRACLVEGLLCRFPHNNLQLMVQSGAKGSTVNTMQISCLLGQIELEGKRPPRMINCKTLPCYPVFELAPRAGGFVAGRFLSGILPDEFFFHCMAGREGLIDTAVKTSRSGYLQRCLIKHLEGIAVAYDQTVRDSDGSVVQFLYGEDGMDVCKSQFLNTQHVGFLADNLKAIYKSDHVAMVKKNDDDLDNVNKHSEQVASWRKKHGNPLIKRRTSEFLHFARLYHATASKSGMPELCTKTKTEQAWLALENDTRKRIRAECGALATCPSPVTAVFQPASNFGSLNERLESLLRTNSAYTDKSLWRDVICMKSMQSMCPAGEPVGLLAAQSIGEPSTQMTLNTFHFAGRGEMNVTLGIPRLREILMTASKNLKTPSMEIPFSEHLTSEQLSYETERIRRALNRVVVADVLERIRVDSKLQMDSSHGWLYRLRFEFLPKRCYRYIFAVRGRKILLHMRKEFINSLLAALDKSSKRKQWSLEPVREDVAKKTKRKAKESADDEDDNGLAKNSKSGADGDTDDEANCSRSRKRNSRPNDDYGENDEDDDDDDDDDGGDDEEEDAKRSRKHRENAADGCGSDFDDDGVDDQMYDSEPDNESDADLSENQSEFKDDLNEEHLPTDARKAYAMICANLVDRHPWIKSYSFDQRKYEWCELTLLLPLRYGQINLTNILRKIAATSVVWEVPNIRRAITYEKDGVTYLRTDGINILRMFQYEDILNLNRLYCNDIHQMANTYGIEAANRVIVKEVKDVFNVYGINVDTRHLLLIADYMTSNGTYEPMNRKGMENSASPLQQMSFEASMGFLRNAVLNNKTDHLRGPSGSLMVGKTCETGTGHFGLRQKLPPCPSFLNDER